MHIHKSITRQRVTNAVERRLTSLDNPGFCKACGCEVGGCEPDAENYECEACGEHAVDGAEQLLLTGSYHVKRKATA